MAVCPRGLFVGCGAALLVSAAGAATASQSAFSTAMSAAMAHMHRAMMVAPTGDPDADFARMMIPHHQGAIDMARVELQYGKDPRMRRLAEGIVVEQAQEIAVMQDKLADLGRADQQPEHSHD